MVAVDDILKAPKDGESRIFTALFGDKGFFPIPVSFEQLRNTQNGKKPPGHRPDGSCVQIRCGDQRPVRSRPETICFLIRARFAPFDSPLGRREPIVSRNESTSRSNALLAKSGCARKMTVCSA